MLAKQKTDVVPCIPGAMPGGLVRTRFYDGMLLTQADMEREQNYWRMKRRLTNRALGTGIVWGLRLEWDERKRKFDLAPGYALDCCGNDLVVECPQEISERSLIDKNDPEIKAFLAGKTTNTSKCPDPSREDQPRKACIILQYTECAGDPQPVHEDACTSNVTHCEYASVRESVKVLLAPPPAEPPPTPMQGFCDKIDAIREACAADPACGLFDSVDALASSDFPVNIEFHNLSSATPGSASALLQPEARKGADETRTESMDAFGPTDDVLITLSPAPGHVFVGGSVQNNRDIDVQPFAVTIDVEGAALLAADGPAFTLNELQVQSLFTNDVHVQANLAISAGVDGAGNGFISATTSEYAHLPKAAICNDKLSPLLILNGDPACIGKTLALTALCGWFRGMLGDEKSEPASVANGKHIVAWWVCYIAWKLLFGANLNDEKSGLLMAAFQELLEDWCGAFTYPGPYCTDDHHGVYLGCVELSPKGNILCFDQWEHRRHVITGPLLTHWGSLFGLAPVDVVVGRLAGWICCLSNTSSPAITADMAMRLIDGFPLNDYGMEMVAGGEEALNAHIAANRLTAVRSSESISMMELAGRVLEMIVKGDSARTPQLSTSRTVRRIDDMDLYLLEPRSSRFGRFDGLEAPRESVRLIGVRAGELRPAARSLVAEYTNEVVRAIAISKLAVVRDDDVMKTLVEELEANRVVSIADLLDTGAERAAQIGLARFDEFDHIDEPGMVVAAAGELVEVGESIVGDTIAPFAEEKIKTGGGPLLGEHLNDKDNAKLVGDSVRKHLRPRSLGNNRLKEIGANVAKRRPLIRNRDDDA